MVMEGPAREVEETDAQEDVVREGRDKEKGEEQSVESSQHSPDYPLLQFEYDNIFDDICL